MVSASLAGATFTAQAKISSNDATDINNATVTLEQAVGIALTNVPGIAVEADFESKKGQLLWEVEVST